jgi:hypothetical protein
VARGDTDHRSAGLLMFYVIALEFLFLIADGIIAARVKRLLSQRKASAVGKVHDLAGCDVDHPHAPQNE